MERGTTLTANQLGRDSIAATILLGVIRVVYPEPSRPTAPPGELTNITTPALLTTASTAVEET
jgi:hypothetical protein